MPGPSSPMQISGRGQAYASALESSRWGISRDRTCFRSCNGTFHLLRAPGIGQNWILEPTSSIGSQCRNIPFREDIVESAVRTTVSVPDSHPSEPSPLQTVNVDASLPPFPETFPRLISSIRNKMENAESQQEVPNLSWQELLPWLPTIYREGGVHRNFSYVHAPLLMLVNRGEYGAQVQLRIDQDRLVANQTDLSYLTWQGVLYSPGQMPNHLS